MGSSQAGTLSKTQIDKLGERLRKSNPPSEEDLVLLQQVRRSYAPPMDEARQVLESVAFDPVTRLKGSNTIIAKLIRQRTRLSSMQDIAGLRIVGDIGLDEQDDAVSEIADSLPGARIDDKRERPTHGYRAVHLIAHRQGLPVEIQVRTTMQNRWAQLVEKLTDEWGRGIQYGEPPLGADSELGGGVTRRQLFQDVLGLSRAIRSLEEQKIAAVERPLRPEYRGELPARASMKARRRAMRALRGRRLRAEQRLERRMRVYRSLEEQVYFLVRMVEQGAERGLV